MYYAAEDLEKARKAGVPDPEACVAKAERLMQLCIQERMPMQGKSVGEVARQTLQIVIDESLEDIADIKSRIQDQLKDPALNVRLYRAIIDLMRESTIRGHGHPLEADARKALAIRDTMTTTEDKERARHWIDVSVNGQCLPGW
jgi:hypothetical protein